MKKTAIATIAVALGFGACPVHCEATHYSKLAIITAAKQAGKWQALKSWIAAADYEDEWLAAAYFSDEYPIFAQITNTVVTSGVATDAEVKAILAASKDTAPDALLDAMYKRDVKTDSGRVKWHGKRIAAPISDPSNMTQTTTYEDGTVFVDEMPERTPAQSVQAANARLKTTIVTNGIPAKLAAARLQTEKNKIPVEVNVQIVAGRGTQL